jgi:hypothetical protein
MSIFFIFIIASITRAAFLRSLSLSIWPRVDGVICHDRPNLSFSQFFLFLTLRRPGGNRTRPGSAR